MFSELEENEFSEVNRAMVISCIYSLLQYIPRKCSLQGMQCPAPQHLSNSCIYSCNASSGSAPCRECGAPSTCVQLIVVLFVLPEPPFQWKLFVTDLPFIEPLFCLFFFFFPNLEFKGSCCVDRYGNMLTASPLLSISTLNKFQIFKLAF